MTSALKPPPSRLDNVVAGLELATSIMQLIDYGLERREAKRVAAESARAAHLLTSLHLEDFPGIAPPADLIAPAQQQPSNKRRWFRGGRQAEPGLSPDTGERERQRQQWLRLRRHDPDEVIATVDRALADNASQSTCIDAGTSPTGNYVTLLVQYPGLEIVQGIVQTGSTTRPRTEKEMIDLYQRALASTVIATAKEALAYAPAATEAYVVVLRYDMRGRFKKTSSQLDAIYAGVLGRSVLTADWTARSPLDEMLTARTAQFNQDRKGRFRPLGDDASTDLQQLVASISELKREAQARPTQPRFTRVESLDLMQFQGHEAFAASCQCPGCGELATHQLRQRGVDEPSWAQVIRTCAVCNREWAQG